jgi:hypothetical protein
LSQVFLDAYNPTQAHLAKVNREWTEYQDNYPKRNRTVDGGVSDMWLISMFVNFFKDGICYTDSAYDHVHGFTNADFPQDELGLPYRLRTRVETPEKPSELIPMKTLHFQGAHKKVLIACASIDHIT